MKTFFLGGRHIFIAASCLIVFVGSAAVLRYFLDISLSTGNWFRHLSGLKINVCLREEISFFLRQLKLCFVVNFNLISQKIKFSVPKISLYALKYVFKAYNNECILVLIYAHFSIFRFFSSLQLCDDFSVKLLYRMFFLHTLKHIFSLHTCIDCLYTHNITEHLK